jgi:hypothetical protein
MPVFLNARRIVCADHVDRLGFFGQLNCEFALAPTGSIGFADLVIASRLEQVDETKKLFGGIGLSRLRGVAACSLRTQRNHISVLGPSGTVCHYSCNQLLLGTESGESIVPRKPCRVTRFQPDFHPCRQFSQLTHQPDELLQYIIIVSGVLHLIRLKSTLANSIAPLRPVLAEPIRFPNSGLATKTLHAERPAVVRCSGSPDFFEDVRFVHMGLRYTPIFGIGSPICNGCAGRRLAGCVESRLTNLQSGATAPADTIQVAAKRRDQLHAPITNSR